MENDLISRQDAIDALGDEPEVWTGKDEYAQGLNNQWHYDRNAILGCPSAQPEQRKGEWIPHHDEVMLFDGMSIGGMACSVCGWKTHNKMHLIFGCPYKYCPNCGADMRD